MIRPFLALLALLAALPGSSAHAGSGDPPDARLFESSPRAFRKRADAARPIDFQAVDLSLLSAAIFHETNDRRATAHRQRLRYDPAVWRAAAVQARAMREARTIGHVLPSAKKQQQTPWSRVMAAGLKPHFVAENVATVIGLRHPAGKPLYRETRDGRRVLTRTPGGAPVESHTCLSLAKALLDSWMESPHHRENILTRDAEALGCAAVPADRNGIPVFYSAQVFFTPSAETESGSPR